MQPCGKHCCQTGTLQGSSPRQHGEAGIQPSNPILSPGRRRDGQSLDANTTTRSHAGTIPLHGHDSTLCWVSHEKERKGRGKRKEKKEEVIKQPSCLLLAPPSVIVNPEWSLPAAGSQVPWVGVTSASGRCMADRAWIVLRSCSSLAMSSFWPASVDTASVSWICSSAQRTGKKSRGRHPGVAQTPKFCQGDTEKLRNPQVEHQSQLTGSNPIFSLFLGAAGGTMPAIPALLQAKVTRGPAHLGDAPGWAATPGRDQRHVPAPEAMRAGSCLHRHSWFKCISKIF